MSKVQQWVAIGVAAMIAVLAAGWFFVVAPQRAHARALQGQATAQRGATAALSSQLHMLQAQAKQLPAKQVELAGFARQIPSSAALPALIRSLSAATAAAGVDLVTISPAAPAALVTAVAPVPAAAASGAPTDAAAAPKTGAPPPTTLAAPAAGASGLQTIGLTLKLNGSYAQLEEFVADLEGMQRVLIINGYSLGPQVSCKGKCKLDLELNAQVFTMPALAAPPAVPRTSVPKTVK